MDKLRGEQRTAEGADDRAGGRHRRSDRFVQYVMVWAVRNWSRGAAGRVNVHRELEAALSPVAARIACVALGEIMRLLARESERPILVRPVPCRMTTDDEQRLVTLCRAVLAGDGECARRVAAELVRAPATEMLVDHIHTALVAILEGSLPAHTDRPAGAAPITMH